MTSRGNMMRDHQETEKESRKKREREERMNGEREGRMEREREKERGRQTRIINAYYGFLILL